MNKQKFYEKIILVEIESLIRYLKNEDISSKIILY